MKVIGYGNAGGDVAIPSFGWAVVHADSGIVFGFVARSSCIRVSRHQNLENGMGVIKLAASLAAESGSLPERSLTVSNILTLPFDNIQDMKNAVLGPSLIENAIQDRILRQY